MSNQKEGKAGCIDEGASTGWQGVESGGRRTAGAGNAGTGSVSRRMMGRNGRGRHWAIENDASTRLPPTSWKKAARGSKRIQEQGQGRGEVGRGIQCAGRIMPDGAGGTFLLTAGGGCGHGQRILKRHRGEEGWES